MLPYFALSQTSGWDNLQTTTTFGFGSQKFNSQLASAFKVQVPFPIYIQGKITTVLAPWWLLVLVFMIVYPILDIIFGIVPPFSKARERGLSGVETSKTVFTIGFTLLAMFVTPLVPSVVELVAFGTTAGIFWFWMLVIVIIVWGTNWLFGESAFGDPFRTGAAGLGHIGSSGITKLRKHWGKEMSDTTNEGIYLQSINNILGTKARTGYKEEELIKILRSLLSEVIRNSSVNSFRTRDALDAMLKRAEELKAYFQNEKMIDADITNTLTGLIKINDLIEDYKADINGFEKYLIELAGTLNLNVASAMKTPISTLKNRSFSDVINELKEMIDKDTSFDKNQEQLSRLTKELTLRSSKATNDEINMIDSIITNIKEILTKKVTPDAIKKFIPFCSNLLVKLESLEKNDTDLMRRLSGLVQQYSAFYIQETGNNAIISKRILDLKNAYDECFKKNTFA